MFRKPLFVSDCNFVSRLFFVFFYAIGDKEHHETSVLNSSNVGGPGAWSPVEIVILGLHKPLGMHLKLPNKMKSSQFISMKNTHDQRCKASLLVMKLAIILQVN